MRISDWSSDVCSSDLEDWQRLVHPAELAGGEAARALAGERQHVDAAVGKTHRHGDIVGRAVGQQVIQDREVARRVGALEPPADAALAGRSEEHTSELQSLMRSSYAVFCLKKKTNKTN